MCVHGLLSPSAASTHVNTSDHVKKMHIPFIYPLKRLILKISLNIILQNYPLLETKSTNHRLSRTLGILSTFTEENSFQIAFTFISLLLC